MKRILSFLLCLSMVISMLPMTVFAEEAASPVPTEQVLETTGEETEAATEEPETEASLAPATESTRASEPETSEAPEVEPTEAPTEATTAPTEEASVPATVPEETVDTTDPTLVTEDAALSEAEEACVLSELVWVTDVDEDLPSNEELFAGYVEQQFYGSGISTFGITAGSLLTGDEKLVYDAVIPYIKKLASGEKSNAVIAVGKPVNGYPVDAEIEGSFSGTTFTSAQTSLLVRALLSDLPYEMYWMDKTVGYGSYYRNAQGSSRPITHVYLYFSVCEAYQSPSYDSNDPQLDTDKTGATATSVSNAKAIVDKYAGKSDYEKLVAYKKEICNLVDYNWNALGTNVSYGDPWQLIHVFDGDSSTKVVCEGYSKAYQYLCDMSVFETNLICNSAVGFMQNGGHMWNIVSIEGKNYMADITNSDSNSVGSQGGLFLVGGNGSIETGYTFLNYLYTYDEYSFSTFGTGPDSILRLDTQNLTASNFPTSPDISSTQEFLKLLDGSKPVILTSSLELDRNITISRDMTIGEDGELIVPSGVTLTIPEGVTITNRGSIQVLAYGALNLEGTISGNLPQASSGSLLSTYYGTFIATNTDSYADLCQAAGAAESYGTVQILLGTNVTLTGDLGISDNASLVLSGADAVLNISSGYTLTNAGEIHVMKGATLNMTGGTYEEMYDGVLYKHYSVNTDTTAIGATLTGIPSEYIIVEAEGFNGSQLNSMLSDLAKGTSPAKLNYLASQNMSLNATTTWPSYGTMTIPSGVTLTVAAGAELLNNGTILLEGKMVINGSVDAWGHPIRITRSLSDSNRNETYVRKNILVTSGTLPAFVFPGTKPTQLNCNIPTGSGTAENPLLAGVGNAITIRMEEASPFGADVLKDYYTFQIVDSSGYMLADLFGDGYEPYSGKYYHGSVVQVRADEPGTVTLRVTPKNSLYEPYDASYARDIVISFKEAGLDIALGGSYFLHEETTYGLWAGSSLVITPTLVLENSDIPVSGTIQYQIGDGAVQSCNGTITITAPEDLSAVTNTTVTLSASGMTDVKIPILMLPGDTTLDVKCGGETVTGQTQVIYLGSDPDPVSLSALVSPAWSGYIPDWTSSDQEIATVTSSGKVTFTGNTGTVTISITLGGRKSASVTYNVVGTIQPHKDNPTALIGGSSASFLVEDSDGNTLKSSAVKWSLCDEYGEPLASHPYASVSSSGKLTTKAVANTDTVYLMAQAAVSGETLQLTQPVEVVLYPAVSSAVIFYEGEPASGTIIHDIGTAKPFTLDYLITPYNAEAVKSIAWSSSKPKIAEIDPNTGVVTVKDSGTVTFTLTVTTLNNKKTTAKLTMKFATYTRDLAIYADGSAAGDEMKISSEESVTFTAVTNTQNVTTPGYKFVLSNKNAGTISSKGVFKAKTVANPTQVVLTAVSKDGYCTSEPVTITVMPAEGTLILCEVDESYQPIQAITKTTQTATIGDKMYIGYDVINQNPTDYDVTWTSSKPSVADFEDPKLGILTVEGNGNTTITATAGQLTASFTLKVSKMSESVEVSVKKNAAPVLAAGKSLSLVGTVSYNDGKTQDTKVTWSMEPTDLATLSSSGKLTAAKNLITNGTVTITATAKDGRAVSEPFEVTIYPAAAALEIYQNPSKHVTNTTQTVDLSDNCIVPLSAGVFPVGSCPDVTWKSSNTKTADFVRNSDGSLAVDDFGNVQLFFLKTGTVTITATANDGTGKKASFKIAAVKTVKSLRLPTTAFVGGGKSLNLTKVAGYEITSDATNKKLTWSMTMVKDGATQAVPKTIATLSSTGVLTTKTVKSPVTLTIQARTIDGSNLVAYCTVTIYPVTKGVALYNDSKTAVTNRTVTLTAGSAYTIYTDTTNASGYGLRDDGTADEYYPAEEAWTITANNAALDWVASQVGCIQITRDSSAALKGKTVTLTVKANDGSGKSAYVKLNFT